MPTSVVLFALESSDATETQAVSQAVMAYPRALSSALADDFSAWWTTRHAHAWPVGWSLRARGPRHWMRIHSLPDGRFDPDSEAEWSELLARHREVSIATLGDGMECWLVLDPGQIYAPYPGGADLFFPLFCEHDDAMRRFGRWRSRRADGL